MTDRNRSQNCYETGRSYSRDRLQKYYDRNKSCGRDRSPEYYKNNYEREYYNTFQDHGNRRKYKDHYKDKYRNKNFYDNDRSYDRDNSQGKIGCMTETGHIVETGTIHENTKETGHIVKIDCKTTVEMSIRRKIISIREGLEITMKTPMRTGMVEINISTNTEMKAII